MKKKPTRAIILGLLIVLLVVIIKIVVIKIKDQPEAAFKSLMGFSLPEGSEIVNYDVARPFIRHAYPAFEIRLTEEQYDSLAGNLETFKEQTINNGRAIWYDDPSEVNNLLHEPDDKERGRITLWFESDSCETVSCFETMLVGRSDIKHFAYTLSVIVSKDIQGDYLLFVNTTYAW